LERGGIFGILNQAMAEFVQDVGMAVHITLVPRTLTLAGTGK
jgi:hypothetical protein